ncbi:TOX high mobility group box family member 4-A isoform X1 [Salmo salar]|uniref:TOX high mobility group box family member 4-A isoform X1 n=2 Tax=Salmo salar TaxID=8030 RepID=A0A1S3M031_SALSA|nr:TOX high mobility group box family member 4-A-like isoform X1 [Salmo salar]|eukprot:XP_013996284.1 PREDICTED: TOX high mobility group box family member 4-A-like isoform X1 [Salmo salar]
MDLHFYSDLSDGTDQNADQEFLEAQVYNGYDPVNKFPGGSDTYLTISGAGHPFLSSEQTFHTPSLGDEVFEIPPISLDQDSALSVGDEVSHFGELSGGAGGPSGAGSLARNAVVGGNDPSFASTYVNPNSQGLEHLSLRVMSQPGGGALLSSTLGVELGHSIGSHFSSSSPMTIDVPLGDMNHGLLGHNQLTTIDQSELSAQLGLGLHGGNILSRSKSPDQLSATPSPAGSLQDDDMDDFRKSVLVDSPMSLSVSPAILSHLSTMPGSAPMLSSSISPALVRRGGGKPAMVAATAGPGGGKKGKKKKDPNEPQKPVSAYALFFRDTQAAIKGQNPNATFGEVSKIVASMWDSLGEEQKQVYKRKTEAAKKEYLKALSAYRANQLSQPSIEMMDTASSPPPVPEPVNVALLAPARPSRLPQHNPDQNTITNICTSNIILDVPQVTTRSRTGAHKPLTLGPTTTATPTLIPNITATLTPTITKIIISKQMLQDGAQLQQIPTSMVTVLPGGVRTLLPSAPRQPPPLQQMQHAPPPPRLQQMVHSPAPPPLQAKPRGSAGPGLPVSITATPPPPLQITIVPASLQADASLPIIVTTTATANSICVTNSTVPTSAYSTPTVALQLAKSTDLTASADEDAVTEEFTSGEMEMEFNMSPGATDVASGPLTMCVRAGCTNPAIESTDWDKEYCSNECVATHCRDIFMAWCSIRNHNTMVVK